MLTLPEPIDNLDGAKLLTGVYEKGERYVIASTIYQFARNMWQRPLKLKRDLKPISLMVLFGIQLIVFLLAAQASHQTHPLTLAQLLAIMLINTSLVFAIREEYHILIPGVQQAALSMTANDSGRAHMYMYFRRVFNLKRQLAWAIVVGLFSTAMMFILNSRQGIVFQPIVYFGLLTMFFFVGHTLYWPFGCAEYLVFLSQCELKLYSLSPSEDENITLISRLINALGIYGGPYILLFAGLMYLAFVAPLQQNSSWGILLFWYTVIVIAVIFWFACTNYYLTKIIANEKNKVLSALRARLDRLYEDMGNDLDPVILEKIQHGQTLYEQIKKSANTSVSIHSLRSALAAIAIQSLPLLTAVDWPYLLKLGS